MGRFLTNYAYRQFGKKRVLQIAGSFICLGFFISTLLGSFFESIALKVNQFLRLYVSRTGDIMRNTHLI